MELVILVAIWFLFLVLTFRFPGAPRISRLLLFLMWLGVSAVLAYTFAIEVLDWNPNTAKVSIANHLTDDKMIDLQQIAPGVYDLDYIHRVDTDWAPEGENEKDELAAQEWLVFYQYDVVGASSENPKGPFGAAIYDPSRCRPPAIDSYELVPRSYDYLGQNWASIHSVDNIIPYQDPLSHGLDRPEVLISGLTRGLMTDLNIFRKAGIDPSCLERQEWQRLNPDQCFAEPYQVHYENIGSFRGNHRVRIKGSTVTVWDRGPFERSQLTIEKQYRPNKNNGTYWTDETFNTDRPVLMDPVEESVTFGQGQPDDIPEVYYPEKAVLAFYLNLGKDAKNLERARSYLSPSAQQIYDIKRDPFGLSTDPANPARARQKLARVLVYEIRYQPDIRAEQLHEDQDVTVTVLGVNEKGQYDKGFVCQVTWTVVAVENPQALPYGCEWGLESFWTTCPPGEK